MSELKVVSYCDSQGAAVVDLMIDVFSASDGAEEGQAVGQLVTDMVTDTPPQDFFAWLALDGELVVGGVFFSLLLLPNGERAFILSPLAVSTGSQRRGIGQQLMRRGLRQLAEGGVRFVFTYGDPNYYSKVGFIPIAESAIQAPFTLSQPEGWLALSLDGSSIEPQSGPCICVNALSDPSYW